MKKLMLLLGFMAVMMSCEKATEDMSGSDLPGSLTTNPNTYTPTSSKDSLNPRTQTAYYFSGYEVSKTAASEKMGMDVAKAPDNPAQLYVSGYSFVNMFGATYTYDEKTGTIKNKELITTEMAGPDAANKAETEYYKNLQEATKIVFEEKQIKILVGNPTKEVLIFKKR